jgi:hypothetical protein
MSELFYEPGPTGSYGSGGIPRDGMEERYSTALWRDGPSAFWLHPEGPLSNKTPKQYFKPKPAPVYTHDRWGNPYANSLGSLASISQLAQIAQYQSQASMLAQSNQRGQQRISGIFGIFGGLF